MDEGLSSNPDVTVNWVDAGREPQNNFDRKFPWGKPIDGRRSGELAGCQVLLPWPAERCGLWLLTCRRCGMKLAVTAAGRVDDATSVILPCEKKRA